MISLFTWTAVLVAALVIPAWAVSASARRLGSPRGQFRIGLLVVLFLNLVNGVATGVSATLGVMDETVQAVANLALLALNAVVVFLALRRTFRIPTGRTWLVFGAYLVVGIVQVGLVYGVLRPFVSQSYRLPTQSMSPTLEPGDRIFVNKLIRPRRWDLVVYQSDASLRSAAQLYCKRLVGLPGERLRFESGCLLVNDQLVELPEPLRGRLYVARGLPESLVRYAEGETIMLGPDEYFFVGDNVDKSADSRLEGPTADESLVGVVDMIYWSPRRARILR